jgi:transcriptional regulator with XRE-family HTH domain
MLVEAAKFWHHEDMPAEDRRQALADAAKSRRTQLGMTKAQLAREAGININTYNQIEAGQQVRDATYGKIEPVLQWAAGSCRDVLDGGKPTIIEPLGEGAVVSPVSGEELGEAVGRAVQHAALAVSDDLTAKQIRAMTQWVLEELRRQGKI